MMPLQSIEQRRSFRTRIPKRKTTAGRSALAALALTAFLSIGVGTVPESAYAGESETGFVYTADEHGKSVSAIDLRNRTVVTTPVPIEPHNIQITADGTRLQIGRAHV